MNPTPFSVGSESVEVKVIYGVESNSTFLECVAHSQQTSIRWTLQHPQAQTSKEVKEEQPPKTSHIIG